MTSRFGRNKRRAARAKIAEMEREVARLAEEARYANGQARQAAREARTARTAALQQFMQSGEFYQHVLERLAREVGHAAGREFGKQAESAMKMALAQDGQHPFSTKLDPVPSDRMAVDIFTVRVPPMQMHLAVPHWEAMMYRDRNSLRQGR